MAATTEMLDLSHQNLAETPDSLFQSPNLKMLSLEDNLLTSLPDDFFLKLPQLKWLDLRSNQLINLPASIKSHTNLETLLLQNNKISALPNELGLVDSLKVLQLSGNNLEYPRKSVVQLGVQGISDFLKKEYLKNNEEQPTEEATKESEITTGIVNKKCIVDRSLSLSAKHIDMNRYVRETMSCRLRSSSALTIKSLSKSAVSKFHSKENNTLPKSAPQKRNKSSNSVYSNSNKYLIPNSDLKLKIDRVHEKKLKDLWLRNLSINLDEQDRQVQGVKSINKLQSWRLKRKNEPLRQNSKDFKFSAPYGNDEDVAFDGGKREMSITYNDSEIDGFISDMNKKLSLLEIVDNEESGILANAIDKELEKSDLHLRKLVGIQKKIKFLRKCL